jgi:hypothetical protein
MNEGLEVLKYILPALIVFSTTWVLLWYFFKSSEKRRKIEFALKNHEITTPLRLQAYERMTLLLERISIDSLLTRTNQPGMNSRQLHTELLASIRLEFEHNLSQQIYMSSSAWEMIRNARIQMIKVINTSAEKTDPIAPALELSKNIVERISDYPKAPTQVAIDFLKKEVQELF